MLASLWTTELEVHRTDRADARQPIKWCAITNVAHASQELDRNHAFSDTEHMISEEPVSSRIRAERIRHGITLRQLASDLGVSAGTLSALETGRTPLSVPRLLQIAELLDVSPAVLLSVGEAAVAQRDEAEDSAGRDWRVFEPLELPPGLGAALQVFVARGFHAATMREVAMTAGLSVAGLYHHHPSKSAMLNSLLEITMSEIEWRVTSARDEGGTHVERLERMVEALALFHALRKDLAFLGASEMRGLSPAEARLMRSRRAQVQHLFDDQAARAAEAGEVVSVEPRTACRAIVTMCTSLPTWFNTHGQLSAQEVAQAYARFAVAVLRVDRGSADRPEGSAHDLEGACS